ncbi:MAG: MFS transporter [Chlamydiales bacterium]|nr:MFS transporter [Chlamydiales bacterium]
MLFSHFARLNYVQFLAAINENLFKLLAAYFLIEELGEEHTNTIMAIVGALFILPFLLFSSVGGVFADRWQKNRIIWITRIFEACFLFIALFIFGFHLSYGAYIILFLMSTSGAIFGPSKYGIIPEILPMERILFGNSVIASFTYLGIIFGTALSSFAVWYTTKDFFLCLILTVLFALIGLIISLFLPKTPVENKTKHFPIFVYSEIWDALKQMWHIPSLSMATFAFAYLLFLGGFLQLNLIPYAIQHLGLSDIYGGYFFLSVALGLGCGSYLTDRISRGKIRLGMVPISGLGISAILILMWFISEPWWLTFVWMIILGFFGGIFLVPPQAFILAASPEKDRGRNFATANFFSFFCALLASGALYLLNVLLALSPANSFFVIAIFNIGIMLFMMWRTDWLKTHA